MIANHRMIQHHHVHNLMRHGAHQHKHRVRWKTAFFVSALLNVILMAELTNGFIRH